MEKLLEKLKNALGLNQPSVIGNVLGGRNWNEDIPQFGGAMASYNPSSTLPLTPEPTSTPIPTPNPIEGKIRSGLTAYGGSNLPALEYVPQFTEATQRYPLFQYNPYLLPELAILETSGGRNITRPNNLLNWGINYSGNNEAFSKMTLQDVLERAISGLGERMANYQPFRVDRPLTRQEIEAFAKIYEPAASNYGSNLWEGMNYFANQ